VFADITLNGTMELLNQGIGWANTASGQFKMGALNGTGVMVGNYTSAGVTTVTLGNTNNNGSFSGVIANGTGNVVNLVKIGTGTQTLSGSLPNTYTGMTTLSAGKLILGKSASTNAIGGDLTISPASGWALAANGVELAASEQIPNTAVIHFTGTDWSGFRTKGFTETVAGLDSPSGKGVIENYGQNQTGPANNGTIIIAGSGAYSYNGYIRDYDGGGTASKINLTMSGAGTQTLIGSQITYTGNTTVNSGILELKNNGAGGAFTSPVTLNNSSTLWLTATTGQTSDFRGNTSGNGSVVKKDVGTVRLGTFSGVNSMTHTGNTTIEAGTLSLQGQANGRCFDTTGDLIINGGATFEFSGLAAQSSTTATRFGGLNGSGNITVTYAAHYLEIGNGDKNGTFSGTIGGALTLTKIGAGTQVLSNTNTYTGGTTITGGILQLGDGVATGSVVGSILDNAALVLAPGTATALTLSGAISGTGTLAMNGPGTATLDATCPYSGTTTVTGGTLVIPATRALSGTSAVSVTGGTLLVNGTVNLGATVTASGTGVIKGNGTIGALTLNAGGTVSPGLSPGTINVGDTIWNGGGIYEWEVNNFQGTVGNPNGWDLLNIAGTLTFIPSASPFVLDLDTLKLSDDTPGFAAGTMNLYQMFEIAEARDGIFGFDPAQFTFDTADFFNALGANPFRVVQLGNRLYLEQVPEPTTMSLLALGGLALLRRRRKS
jgi:fibronectin-binding autotransporter adhesin